MGNAALWSDATRSHSCERRGGSRQKRDGSKKLHGFFVSRVTKPRGATEGKTTDDDENERLGGFRTSLTRDCLYVRFRGATSRHVFELSESMRPLRTVKLPQLNVSGISTMFHETKGLHDWGRRKPGGT